jgi:hypothetical protein
VAEWIRNEHAAIERDHVRTLARYVEIGEALAQIQEALPYGEYGAWVAENLPGISDRHLRRYKAAYLRRNEPLAKSDPAGFLAQINGHASPDAASEATSNGRKSPEKRTPKSRKAKTPPPIDNTPAPTPIAVGKVSREIAFNNAAEALKKVIGVLKQGTDDWKKGSLASLIEDTGGNARIAAGLELVGKDLDALVEMVEGDRDVLVERLLGFAREVDS